MGGVRDEEEKAKETEVGRGFEEGEGEGKWLIMDELRL